MTPGRNTDLGSATVTPRRSGKWGMLLIIIVRGSLGYNQCNLQSSISLQSQWQPSISTMILKIPIKDTAPSRVNLKITSRSGFPDYLLSLNIQIYSFSESSISACHFFDHVSGPLKLKLLRGLWPFSFGRQTSWCDWRWSGDVESAEPSDSSLESESDVRSANLSFKTNSILMEERMLQFTFPLQQRQRQSCSDPSCRRSLRRRQGSSRREPSPWCYPRLSNRRSPGHVNVATKTTTIVTKKKRSPDHVPSPAASELDP